MVAREVTEIKSKSKLIIIVLLACILALTAIILFIVVSDNQVSDIMQVFQSNGEYTILLDEFVVNLKADGNIKHYLKIKIALMYTDEKQGEIVEASVNKIRDVIISNIRSKTYQDILNDTDTLKFKEEVINNVNTVLNDEIIKGLYVTDMIVQ